MADIDNKKEDNGQITRLKFRSKVVKKQDEIKLTDNDLDVFEVMINPESISRKLSLEKTNNKSGRSKSKGDTFGTSPEVFSFEFFLDGTGVVPSQNGRTVNEQIKKFLNIVYEKGDNTIQALIIDFLDNSFIVCTNSIDITYSLFDTKGQPLRAKVSCSFSTVKSNKPSHNGKSNKSSSNKKVIPQAEEEKPKECDCNEARSKECSSLYEQMPDNAIGQRNDGSYIYMN